MEAADPPRSVSTSQPPLRPAVAARDLAPLQEEQVQSPAFKAWFGDWEQAPSSSSKVVVGPDNRPGVVYHGTKVPFTFDQFATIPPTDKYEEETGRSFILPRDPTAWLGAHFSWRPRVAALMTEKETRPGRGHVFPAYLNIRRPLEVTENELKCRALRQCLSPMPAPLLRSARKRGHPDKFRERYDSDPEFRAQEHRRHGKTAAHLADLCRRMGLSLREEIQAKGHDGIIYENRIEGGLSYVAFEPTQVKSAIANDGSFDEDDPSILS